jgi:segregation and condensation protein A
MDLIQQCESGTYWKNIIYDIVGQEAFDPWDIDVGLLADSYLQKIREIKMVDFEVPGTVVLVGSVLLKLKSDMVSSETFIFEENLSLDQEVLAEEPVADFESEGIPPSTIEPQIFVRRVPKRKITLPELMIFLKKVITQVEKKDKVKRERVLQQVEVQINRRNLERIMRQVHREIRKLAKGDKMTFRELCDEWKREAIVAYFFPILHLAHKNKIIIEQPEMFGEIFLSPNHDEKDD